MPNIHAKTRIFTEKRLRFATGLGRVARPAEARRRGEGFTLLEALVALIVLAMVIGVVLQTQLTTLNMEQAARATCQARREIDRVFTEVRLGASAPNIMASVSPESEVSLAITALDETEDSADWLRWDIVSQVRPSLKFMLITRSFE